MTFYIYLYIYIFTFIFLNADWLKWQEMWMENPLITLDANQIENVTTDIHNAMLHCAKVFQENPSRLIEFIEFELFECCM